MPLLHSDVFEPIFSRFSGMHIGYVELDGNVGDALITLATHYLLKRFKIAFTDVKGAQITHKRIPEGIDELVISGGGNLGRYYQECFNLRQAALECGLPVTILPQSFVTHDEDLSGFKRVYVRERFSQAFDKRFELMPDLALGLEDCNGVQPPHFELGVFLREDSEGIFKNQQLSLIDPVNNNEDPVDYVEFASRFNHIVTDRLHFAISGLHVGREVTLLPNRTGKNLAIYQTWLRDLGCQWSNHPGGYRYNRQEVIDSIWDRLVPVSRDSLPWHSICVGNGELSVTTENDHALVLDKNKTMIGKMDSNAHAVWSLCDGNSSIRQISSQIADVYEQPELEIAEDVLSTVDQLYRGGSLIRHRSPEIVVEILPDRFCNGLCYRRAEIRHPRLQAEELWFGTRTEHRKMQAEYSDCFVIAVLMRAMADGLPLRLVNGKVNPGLIENLMEFQSSWIEWRKNLNKIEIFADVEATALNDPCKQIATFSGGLDSCYTLLQHNRNPSSELKPIDALLFVHGLDIPLTDQTGFSKAIALSSRISEDAQTPLLEMRTNFRGIKGAYDWQDSHGTALAAALSLWIGNFSSGIISSTMNDRFQAVWGSNQITDPLMSSRGFQIRHFGFEADRLEKFEALSSWPAAIENLRVCWESDYRDQNCGRCHKCILTQLTLKCLKLPVTCFHSPRSDQELTRLIPRSYSGGLNRYDFTELARYCADQQIDTPWAEVLRDLYLNSVNS